MPSTHSPAAPRTPSHIPGRIPGTLPPDLVAMQRFARLMDEAVPIPGTNRHIGVDALIGLIPGIGDVLGALASLWIVYSGLRHRVPILTVVRMMGNLLIDMLVGAIPLLGDIFDVLWEGNIKNADLVIAHRDTSKPPRSRQEVMGVFLAIVIGTLALLGFLIAWAVGALIHLVFVR